MYSLIPLLILVALTGGSAEIIRTSQVIKYEMGGSQVTFSLNRFQIDEIDNVKCVVRYHDERDSIEIKAFVPRDGLIAICRLPSNINAGAVDVELAVAISTTPTKFARSAKASNTMTMAQTLFVNPIPESKVKVVENWDTNELTLTWNVKYFEQFFNPGATIQIQLSVYVADSFEPDFKVSQISPLVGQNSGFATITLSAQNLAKLSKVLHPYYYVLRPIGTQSEIFESSVLFAPTLGMDEPSAETTCSNWLASAEVPVPLEEIHPCPPCLCQVELDENFVESEYPPQLVELANGSLKDHVLYYEKVPTQSGYAQTCSYNRLTNNLVTTSPAQAGWIHSVSKDISYEYNYFEDIWPHMLCCMQSNSQELCDLFHEKRPINTGHDYPGTENPCTGWGDPHMVTFESVKYDFMGYGEFWLIHGPEGGEFGVQGRMSPNAVDQKVSFYKAVAVRDRNTTVQIEMRGGKILVFLNEVQLQFPTLPVSFHSGSVFLLIDSSRIDIRTRSGFSLIVESRINTYFDVYGRAAHYNKGKGFMGIFGNFDDDSNNDLTSRDGYVIPPTTENLRDLSRIHHRFGLTWLVNRNESFFVYEDGKSWDDHVNIGYGPLAQYPDPATLPEEVKAICGDSLFCYSEYEGTGSLEMALEVAEKEIALDAQREKTGKTVPMCDNLSRPANGRVYVNGYLDGAVATYSCDKGYDFESGNRLRTCSASEERTQWSEEEPVCIWTCTTCAESEEYTLSHDPSDCRKFFLCSFGAWISLDCPTFEYFDRQTGMCSKNYKCSGVPGC